MTQIIRTPSGKISSVDGVPFPNLVLINRPAAILGNCCYLSHGLFYNIIDIYKSFWKPAISPGAVAAWAEAVMRNALDAEQIGDAP